MRASATPTELEGCRWYSSYSSSPRGSRMPHSVAKFAAMREAYFGENNPASSSSSWMTSATATSVVTAARSPRRISMRSPRTACVSPTWQTRPAAVRVGLHCSRVSIPPKPAFPTSPASSVRIPSRWPRCSGRTDTRPTWSENGTSEIHRRRGPPRVVLASFTASPTATRRTSGIRALICFSWIWRRRPGWQDGLPQSKRWLFANRLMPRQALTRSRIPEHAPSSRAG